MEQRKQRRISAGFVRCIGALRAHYRNEVSVFFSLSYAFGGGHKYYVTSSAPACFASTTHTPPIYFRAPLYSVHHAHILADDPRAIVYPYHHRAMINTRDFHHIYFAHTRSR